ncbi:hypothetical protein N431DRAFT_560557 [Stipitochalara longipes BDJ]|nr:hypothetical protein N431DRAFT_560557 [Stipitochalara longipes BDJ]
MVLQPLTQDLKVTLADPMRTHSGHKIIHVTYGGVDTLDISLRRTIRIPDNGTAYELPPDCGPFPIYSVKQYKSNLPEHMAGKGGLFVPIYEREAMWIKFKSQRSFAIKIHAGGINAVSGEPQTEDIATMLKRKLLLTEGKTIQDYVVAGSQLWLDGIATNDGKVMQFVATPVDSGYSVEAQINGKDTIAGLQFEIIPTKRKPMFLHVMTLAGKHIQFQVEACMTIAHVKRLIEVREGIPYNDRRIVTRWNDRAWLDDCHTLAHYNITDEETIYVIVRLRGGGYSDPKDLAKMQEKKALAKDRQLQEEIKAEVKSEMAVAPGGFINQTIVRDPVPAEDWDVKNVVMFNLQLLNAAAFEHLIGIKAPPTPISPALYQQYGYPFFKLYEEKSGINGSFLGLQSVAQLDRKEGLTTNPDEEADLDFPLVELNSIDKKTEFIPVSVMESMLREMKIADDN